MKVRELITELQQLDQEVDVTIGVYSGCGGYEESYEICDTHEYKADKHGPGAAMVCVNKGCMCCSSTKISKFTNLPQSISQYWIGIENAFDVVSKSLTYYTEWVKRIGKPKDYAEFLEKERAEQGKLVLENISRDLGRLQKNGEKT